MQFTGGGHVEGQVRLSLDIAHQAIKAQALIRGVNQLACRIYLQVDRTVVILDLETGADVERGVREQL